MGRRLAVDRIDNRIFQPTRRHAFGNPLRAHRRPVVGLKYIGADKDDKLRAFQLALPVKFLAAGPGIGVFLGIIAPLFTHCLAGEIQRSLTDRSMAVSVGRSHGIIGKPLDDVAASILQPAPPETELIVLGSEVGMGRIDHRAEMLFEFLLERLHQRLLLRLVLFAPDLRHGFTHILHDLGVLDGIQGLQAFHFAVFLTGNPGEQLASLDDFIDRLVERHGDPLVLAPLAGPFQHLADAVRIIVNLQAGLPLGTDRPVDPGGVLHLAVIVQMRHHRPGRIRVAVHLDQPAVGDLGLDAATGVAVETDRINRTLRLVQFVFIGRCQSPGIGFLHQALPFQGTSHQRRTTYGSAADQE